MRTLPAFLFSIILLISSSAYAEDPALPRYSIKHELTNGLQCLRVEIEEAPSLSPYMDLHNECDEEMRFEPSSCCELSDLTIQAKDMARKDAPTYEYSEEKTVEYKAKWKAGDNEGSVVIYTSYPTRPSNKEGSTDASAQGCGCGVASSTYAPPGLLLIFLGLLLFSKQVARRDNQSI